MGFIDWSDPEDMFGLLVDFVADALAEPPSDRDRRRFLRDLLSELQDLEQEQPELTLSTVIRRLKEIRESADREFDDDPVMIHVDDCIEELERVEDQSVE